LLLLTVYSVDAGLLSLERAVEVLDVQLSLNVQLVHLFPEPCDVLLSFVAVFRVLVLFLLDGRRELLDLLGKFALLLE